MELIALIFDFVLHVDKYLEAFVQNYGTWVYVLLFAIIFVETGRVVMPFYLGTRSCSWSVPCAASA